MRTLVKLSAGVLAICSALALGGCEKAQDSIASTSEVAVTSGAPSEAASTPSP